MSKQIEAEVQRILLQDYEKFYRTAWSYMKNEQDALDVVQESAYKAMKQCRKVRNMETVSTWIYRIVINTALDMIRKKKREICVEEEPVSLSTEDTYQIWDLTGVMNRLEEKDRTIIVLRYFNDLKLEEIAEITGENLNTVKTRLYRTLKKMRLELDPAMEF